MARWQFTKGLLAVDEAKDISAIAETHRRTLETVELEARIAQLEKKPR